jgi:hypothetical protein
MTKVTDKKRPVAIFIFQDEYGAEKKAGLTLDLASTIPNISSLLEGSTSKVEYKYRSDVSQKALTAYFRSVSARVKGIDFEGFVDLSPVDWNFVFWLAFRLGDTQFYEDMSHFPDLMEVADLILKMPEPARLFYFGTYLGQCFGFDCDCDRHRIKLLRREARKWLETLESGDRERYQNTPIPGAYRKYKKQLTHTYDLDSKFKNDWLADNQTDIDSERIFNWYDLDMDTKVHLVHIGAKLPLCACERPFYEMWNAFCSMVPSVANSLWTNMKRNELMKYAQTTDDKKDGVARRKQSFDDLCAYVEFARDRK